MRKMVKEKEMRLNLSRALMVLKLKKEGKTLRQIGEEIGRIEGKKIAEGNVSAYLKELPKKVIKLCHFVDKVRHEGLSDVFDQEVFQKTRESLTLERVKQGYWPFGRPPFGFKLKRKKMTYNKKKPLIMKVFFMASKNATLKQIEEEIKLPTWKIRQILINPVYKGETDVKGTTIYVRTWDIVGKETWQKAQKAMSNQPGGTGPAPWGLKWLDGNVVKDENAKKMEEAFRKRVYEKKTIQEIADDLKVERASLGIRLRNPIYKSEWKKVGEKIVKVERIIDDETWVLAQKMNLQSRSAETLKRQKEQVKEKIVEYLHGTEKRVTPATPKELHEKLLPGRSLGNIYHLIRELEMDGKITRKTQRGGELCRSDILTFVKRQGAVTARDIHEGTGLSKSCVHRHLNAMEEEGAVKWIKEGKHKKWYVTESLIKNRGT